MKRSCRSMAQLVNSLTKNDFRQPVTVVTLSK
jgi:hypothetical protein